MSAAPGKFARVFVFVLAAWLTLLSIAHPLCAQTTVSTGSIVGTVSDPSGAVISGAKVLITRVATGQLINLTTNSSGSLNPAALVPGNHELLVSTKGFSSAEVSLTVLGGNTATVNVKLQSGEQNQILG